MCSFFSLLEGNERQRQTDILSDIQSALLAFNNYRAAYLDPGESARVYADDTVIFSVVLQASSQQPQMSKCIKTKIHVQISENVNIHLERRVLSFQLGFQDGWLAVF